MIALMKKDPQDRLAEEVAVIAKASNFIKYFEKLLEVDEDVGKKLQFDVCQRMYYLCKKRGGVVISLSSITFTIEEVADKFFIILSGSVLVYKERLLSDIEIDYRLYSILTDYYRKNYSTGIPLSADDAVKIMPDLDDRLKRSIIERLSSVDACKIRYNENYLNKVLKSSLSDKHFASIQGFFDQRGILQLSYIGSLTAGMSFGEKGLDDRILRTATIVCDESCHFGVIYKDDYDAILKQVSIYQAETNRRFFYDDVMCRNVSPAISDRLAYDFNKQSTIVSSKSLIFDQDSDIDYVYVVDRGSVMIYRLDADIVARADMTVNCKANKVHKLALIDRGGLFGMEDLFRKTKKRFYSAVALSPCKLLRVSKECFVMHMNNEPVLRKYIRQKCKVIGEHRRHLMEAQGSVDLPSIDQKTEVQDQKSETKEVTAVKKAIATLIIPKQKEEVVEAKVSRYREASTATISINKVSKPPSPVKVTEIRKLFRKSKDADMSKYAKLNLLLTRRKAHDKEKDLERSVQSLRTEESDTTALQEWRDSMIQDKTFLLKHHIDRIQRCQLREKQTIKFNQLKSNRTTGLKLSLSMLNRCKEQTRQRSLLNSSVDIDRRDLTVRRLTDIKDEQRTADIMRKSKPSFNIDSHRSTRVIADISRSSIIDRHMIDVRSMSARYHR